MRTKSQSRTISLPRQRSGSDLEIVTELLQAAKTDYFAYERENTWYLGIGSRASLFVNAIGTSVTTITSTGDASTESLKSGITESAREFASKYTEPGKRVFGQAGFNYAAHSRGLTFTPGKWPLLSLMVPSVEVIISPNGITIFGDDTYLVEKMAWLATGDYYQPRTDQSLAVDIRSHAKKYMNLVAQGISEIKAAKYKKVILSRAIDLEERVDMIATLCKGRQCNTPKRSFSMNHLGFQATGFSPELVMSLQDGKVVTEPLAGTRAYTGSVAERKRLTNELQNDTKEIVEHVISVKEAMEEVSQFSIEGSTVIEDFMATRVRGNVQHLGSRVAGHLKEGKDGWDAFNVLFPSITASGIPKQDALEAIERLEGRPRELYSGAILMMDSTSFEASLVLRTVFQHGEQTWVQAGAGVIEQSKPERELLETCEKLSTIAPFVIAATRRTDKSSNGNMLAKDC